MKYSDRISGLEDHDDVVEPWIVGAFYYPRKEECLNIPFSSRKHLRRHRYCIDRGNFHWRRNISVTSSPDVRLMNRDIREIAADDEDESDDPHDGYSASLSFVFVLHSLI